MTITPAPSADDAGAIAAAESASHGGGWLATLMSGLAFVFSGVSFYTSVLQQADLEVYVPPVLQYGRDAGGEVDVLSIPITISNAGASTGTVLAMELKVESAAPDAEGARAKTFYSAFVGEHPRNPDTPNKAFAPISVPGRASYSETIRFYPQGNPLPKVVSDKGEYRFTLNLLTATPAEPGLLDRLLAPRPPAPITFQRTLPFLSEQHLGFRRGTISMHAADWKPTTSAAK